MIEYSLLIILQNQKYRNNIVINKNLIIKFYFLIICHSLFKTYLNWLRILLVGNECLTEIFKLKIVI